MGFGRPRLKSGGVSIINRRILEPVLRMKAAGQVVMENRLRWIPPNRLPKAGLRLVQVPDLAEGNAQAIQNPRLVGAKLECLMNELNSPLVITHLTGNNTQHVPGIDVIRLGCQDLLANSRSFL